MKNNKLVAFISTLILLMIVTASLAQGAVPNESLVRQYIVELWNRGNIEVVEEVLAPEAILLSPDGVFEGVAAIKSHYNTYTGAFSDLSLIVDKISASDDEVKVKWFLKGTHDGEILGIAPTWQVIELAGSSSYMFEENKIVKEIKDYNEKELLKQLGVLLDTSSFETASTEDANETPGALRYGR